jgi:hypothetical protein
MKNGEIKLNEVEGESGVVIKNKLNYVFGNNVDLQTIKTFRDILMNKNNNTSRYVK